VPAFYHKSVAPAVKATAYIGWDDDPGVGSTVTVGNLTFVAVAGAPAADGEFQVETGNNYPGYDSQVTAANLSTAILAHPGYAAEAWETVGTSAGTGDSTRLNFTAKVGGTAGNSIVFTHTGTHYQDISDDETFLGGTDPAYSPVDGAIYYHFRDSGYIDVYIGNGSGWILSYTISSIGYTDFT